MIKNYLIKILKSKKIKKIIISNLLIFLLILIIFYPAKNTFSYNLNEKKAPANYQGNYKCPKCNNTYDISNFYVGWEGAYNMYYLKCPNGCKTYAGTENQTWQKLTKSNEQKKEVKKTQNDLANDMLRDYYNIESDESEDEDSEDEENENLSWTNIIKNAILQVCLQIGDLIIAGVLNLLSTIVAIIVKIITSIFNLILIKEPSFLIDVGLNIDSRIPVIKDFIYTLGQVIKNCCLSILIILILN